MQKRISFLFFTLSLGATRSQWPKTRPKAHRLLKSLSRKKKANPFQMHGNLRPSLEANAQETRVKRRRITISPITMKCSNRVPILASVLSIKLNKDAQLICIFHFIFHKFCNKCKQPPTIVARVEASENESRTLYRLNYRVALHYLITFMTFPAT